MNRLIIITVIGALCIDPAFAQFAPAPIDSRVDLAPIINPLIQIGGLIITGLCIPLLWAFIGKTLKSWGVEETRDLDATRAVVDAIAQKAIGSSIEKYAVKPGQITVDVKSKIMADAANALVANAGESLTKLGVKDNEQIAKAREIISSRLGLMDAAAAGVPVPNPSQPSPAPVEVKVGDVPVEGKFDRKR